MVHPGAWLTETAGEYPDCSGHEPGRHTIGFDGVHDSITLTHAARGRGGFALGAVLAAEWIAGRRGLHGFDEVVRDLVAGGDRS